MGIDELLGQLHKVCVNHFDELCQDGTEKIRVLSVELDSHTIWGGNGDSDTDITFFITRKGWVSQEVTTEFGLYQKGAGVVKDIQQETAEVDIQRILTQKANNDDIKRLYIFYEQIRHKYPDELKQP